MEQLFNELEQRYVSLKNEHDHVCIERDAFKAKHAALQVSYNEINGALESLQSSYAAKDATLLHREAVMRDMEASQEELQSASRKKQDEIDRMRDELLQQSNHILALQEKLQTSQISLAEAEAREMPRQFEVLRLQRENENLKARVTTTETEVEEKFKLLQDTRGGYSSEISELKLSVSTLTAENKSIQDRYNALKEADDSLNDKYMRSLGEVRDLKILQEEQQTKFSTELNAGKHQLQLYTRYFEENTATIRELEEKIVEIKTTHATKVNTLKEKLAAALDASTSEAITLRADYEKTISELRTELAAAQQSAGRSVVLGDRAVAIVDREDCSMTITEFQGLGPTEMYAKLVVTERELVLERERSSVLEHYLERVHKEVESRAPTIESQKREYRRVLESHDKLAKRMDMLLAENKELKSVVNVNRKKCDEAVEEAQNLEQQNKDLSAQIQNLLYNNFVKTHGLGYMESPANAGRAKATGSASDVISEHLLTFDDVVELQTKNSQLVKVVRKLSIDQENAVARLDAIQRNGGVVPGSGGMSLEAAMKELNVLKDSRQRMEDMVASLVQQRDVLRAMLEEAEGSSQMLITAGAATSAAPFTTPGTTPARGNRTPQSSPVTRQLETRLQEVSEENLRLKERCSRLEMAERSTMEAYEKCKNDLLESRLQSAKAVAEAKFQNDRCSDLQAARDLLQREVDSVTSRCRELDGFVVAQQREASSREALVVAAEERTRAALEKLRRAEVEVEVLTAAEVRAISQLVESREEVKRQASLADSVSRIEAGLFARAEEERMAAAQERDTSRRALEMLKKESADSALVADQKIRSLEDDCANLRRRLEDATADLSAQREELIRSTSVSQAAQEREALLERQLTLAQEQIGSVRGAAVVAGANAEDSATRDLQLDRALKETESLRAQVAAAELHAEQFRKIGVSTEAMLKELRERSAASKGAMEEQINGLQAELEKTRAESGERLASALKSEEEISELQEKARELEKKHAEDLSAANEKIRISEELSVQAVKQMEALRQDAEACQQAARSAQSNYERELQLHASAAARARESASAMESMRVQLAMLNQKISDMTASSIQLEKNVGENKSAHAKEMEQLREEKIALQQTNNLLHSQVQALGVQVERLHNSKSGAIATEETAPAEGDESEDNALAASLAEMREVVRYMKREREILEAKLSVLETENARHAGTIAALQRSLDEARAELRKSLENKGSGRSEDEFNRLMAEVTQLNIVRESNAHLRGENEELSKRNNSLSRELKISQEALSPLKDELRRLESMQVSLMAERDSIANDATYWKDRLHQLVSRYNDVDPEAHRMLAVKLAETESKVAALDSELATLRGLRSEETEEKTKLQEKLESASKELESSKSVAESAGKNAELLRNRLRDTIKTNREMRTQIQDLTKQVEVAGENAKAAAASATAPAPAPALAPTLTSTLVASVASTVAPADVTPAVVVSSATSAAPAAGISRKRLHDDVKDDLPAESSEVVVNVTAVEGESKGTAAPPPSAAPTSEQFLREQLLKRKLQAKAVPPKPTESSTAGADAELARKKARPSVSTDAGDTTANPTDGKSSAMEECTPVSATTTSVQNTSEQGAAETAAENAAAAENFMTAVTSTPTPVAESIINDSTMAPAAAVTGGRLGGRGAGRGGRGGRGKKPANDAASLGTTESVAPMNPLAKRKQHLSIISFLLMFVYFKS